MSDCVFCKIVNKEIKADILFEDQAIVAFKDVVPKAPVHILIIPKQHIEKVSAVKDPSIFAKIFTVAQQLADQFQLKAQGFRVVVNEGKAAGQAVFHLHFHLLGGRNFTWPPG